jgi:hypothetical protein
MGRRERESERVCVRESVCFFTSTMVMRCIQISIIEYLEKTKGAPFVIPRNDPGKEQQVATSTLITH